jgi:ferric-dicitrate binding protein FerR (iron transport regulator)
MKKRFLFIITGFVVIVLCVIAFLWLTQPPLVKAQLVIDSGAVQVRHAYGTWTSADNGMLLYQNDAIKTGDNTSASIILFESSILRLDSNTEVTLKEVLQQAEATSVKIQQDGGRTWNTISKISGIDTYEVQTPVAVASVRGTSFCVQVQANGKTIVGVGTGVVNVSRTKNNQMQNFININKDESVTVDPDKPDQPLEKTPFEKDDWILQNQQKDDTLMVTNKAELYKRIDPYIPELKEKYGVNDQELEVLIDGYLRGDFALPSETPDWIMNIIESS